MESGRQFDRVGVDSAPLTRLPPLHESGLAERDDGVLGGFEVSESPLEPDPPEKQPGSPLGIQQVEPRNPCTGDGR